MQPELKFYGGVNEIGGNKILAQFKEGAVFLDFGQSYAEEGKYFEEFLQPRSKCKLHDLLTLGILPKIDGIYRSDALQPSGLNACDVKGKELWRTDTQSYESAVVKGTWRPDAVFLSHAHMDHCGYISYLGNMPIVCSELTEKLMDAICEIGGLDGLDGEMIEIERREMGRTKGGYFPDQPKVEKSEPEDRDITTIRGGEAYETEGGLRITGFDVDHSIPGAMAALVESRDSQLFYTGDLRFHGRYEFDIKSRVEGLRPDVMICEGTRISETVPDDEKKVEDDLTTLFSSTEGLAMVGFAWKDIERYETVRDAAKRSGRTPVFDPRLAYLLARLGRDVYGEGGKAFLERCESMLYSPADYVNSKHKSGTMPVSMWDSKAKPPVIDKTHLESGVSAVEIRKTPHQYVLHLDYFRFKNILDLMPPSGSIYVRAQCEPFNTRMELSEGKLVNWLKRFNINQKNDNKPYQIHASGHASGIEIQELIDIVKPKFLYPIHTEKPALFQNNNGEILYPCIL
jgi:ribonuclease J